jgi:hypothetical protein
VSSSRAYHWEITKDSSLLPMGLNMIPATRPNKFHIVVLMVPNGEVQIPMGPLRYPTGMGSYR